MKPIVAFAALFLSAVAAAPAAAPAPDGAARAEPQPRYSLVTVRGASDRAAVRGVGGRLVSRHLGVWRVRSSAVANLRGRGAIEYAEPERVRRGRSHVQAGDPLLARQWWYARVGADRVEPPGPGVPLTILDSGLDMTHPEFAQRPATTTLNAQTVSGEGEFHGTAVSSVAAAPVNGVGLVGVYPQATLAMWDLSREGRVTSGDVIAGLEAAVGRGRGIVNISLGGSRSRLEAQAVAAAFARGVIVVASSGNEGSRGNEPSYPGALPHVVTVGSTDVDDNVTAFSTQTRAVDVAAPGADIPVAVPLEADESGYGLAGGTSFSAPMVAGALAWIWTVRSTLHPTQLVEVLRRSARDIGPTGRDEASGFGLLDIPAALTAPAPPPDPFEPNDDLTQVSGAPLFGRSRPPLTTPTRGRNQVTARLDVADDPRDVHRVWVPARKTVTVRAASGADVDLRLLGQRPSGLTARRTRAGATTTLVLRRTGSRGAYVYVSAFVRLDSELAHGEYTMSVTTAASARR